MTLRIKLFAVAMQKAGTTDLEVECSLPANVGEIKQLVVDTCPPLSEILPHCRFAVDDEFASDDTVITEQASVAIIPPVSGGAC